MLSQKEKVDTSIDLVLLFRCAKVLFCIFTHKDKKVLSDIVTVCAAVKLCRFLFMFIVLKIGGVER